jgi:xylosylprotein 4-beta-galactosyltransferase
MRACNWYRFLVLCMLAAALLGVLNLYFGQPPPEPCGCDCTQALARQRAELKVFYEHEIETRDKRIKQLAESASVLRDSMKTAEVERVEEGTGRHRLAVLVPFRNRHEELQEFVPHIHRFLSRQGVLHDIWIINQADSYRFNRASLLNAGFLMSRDRCDYIVMHDVDLLPDNNQLQYSYPPSGPYHISSPSLHPLYHYKTFVGGVLSLTREQFEQVNGLSNLFWGWGREDDEFYQRMKEAGMTIQYPIGITTGYNTFRHNHDKQKRPRDQDSYHSKQIKSIMKDRTSGLSSLQYTLVSHMNMTINNAPFHFVSIELHCDPDVTPACVTKQR